MRVKVGLELNTEGRALAWALEYPGCFAYGKEGPEAVVALARSLAAYEEWANRRGGEGWLDLGDYDLRLVDTWECYTINDRFEPAQEGYEVNAWFLHDWKPLTAEEVERAQAILRWTRADLLRAADGFSEEELDLQRPGERWSVRGILKHVAGAEWWYLDRLGLAGMAREALPKDERERLRVVRERLVSVLPGLVDRNQVVGVDGEFWSPRKLIRRAAWHELDHVQHLLKLY